MFSDALDTTIGGSSSNSYATVEEATAYLAFRSDASSFLALSTDDKEGYLKYATLLNDLLLTPVGTPTSSEQSLLFPRENLIDAKGKIYANDVIPAPIKYAQIEQALYLVNNSIKVPSMLQQGFSSAKLDVMSITLDKTFIPSKVDSDAVNFLELFGRVSNNVGLNVVDVIRY